MSMLADHSGDGMTVDQLRAEIARLHEVRNKVEASYVETVAQLLQKLTTVTAERDALLADHLGDANNKVCIWTENKDGQYETACGQMHEFFDGGPKDNHLQFCGYCGKGLIEQRWNL